jgi:amidophosphoribosyltransferase
MRDNAAPQYCDACFSGDYPVPPSDMIESGRLPAQPPRKPVRA